MLFWIIKILAFIPLWIIFPIFAKKKGKIPKGKTIIVCNHLSNFDAIIILLRFNIRPYIYVKKEAFQNKFVKFFFAKLLRFIEVDRDNFSLSTIKFTNKILKENHKLLIFPEGTRNKTGKKLGEIKSGTALIAIKNKTSITPLWFTKKPKPFHINKIVVGETFELSEYYEQKLNQESLAEADNKIKDKLLELSN